MTIAKDGDEKDRRAAIVCAEIATEQAPIMRAVRSEPIEPADSGWQFLCGATTEDDSTAQVWALYEVLECEPSLEPFLELPAGTILSRRNAGEKWSVRLR
jgi:hypothetical protein